MHIQISVVAVLAVLFYSFYGGAYALLFYVSKRRPTRNNLQDFQATLPKPLQFIYFHPTHNTVYESRAYGSLPDNRREIMGTSFPMPGLEYLYRRRMSDSDKNLSGLIQYLVTMYGILFASIIWGGGIIPPLLYVILFLIPLRVAFFGMKIKHDPDSYLPD